MVCNLLEHLGAELGLRNTSKDMNLGEWRYGKYFQVKHLAE
jgi:hypothetical protein